VFERFADPDRYRNDTVDNATNLEEYSIMKLKLKADEKESSNPNCDFMFMDLYSDYFEKASFLAFGESWCGKELYQECLDR